MAVLLDDGVEDELGRGGGVVVGAPDETLVLLVEQVRPVLRPLDVLGRKLLVVGEEAQDAHVDAHPGAVGGGEVGVCDVAQVGRRGLHEQAIIRSLHIGGAAAAEPDVRGGMAVLLLDLGEDLAAAQALPAGGDAEELSELVARGDDVGLLTGAVDNELALGLSSGNEVGIVALDTGARSFSARARVAGATAASEGETSQGGCAQEVPTRNVMHGFLPVYIQARNAPVTNNCHSIVPLYAVVCSFFRQTVAEDGASYSRFFASVI